MSALKKLLSERTGVPPEHIKILINGGMTRLDEAPLSKYGLVDDGTANDNDDDDSFFSRGRWESWAGFRNKRQRKRITMIGSAESQAHVRDTAASRQQQQQQQARSGKASQQQQQEEEARGAPEDEPALARRIRETRDKALGPIMPELDKLERYFASLNNNAAAPQQQGQVQPRAAAEDVNERPNERLPVFLSETLLQSLLKLDSIEIPVGWQDARKERKEAVRDVQAVLDRIDRAKEQMKATAST